MRFLCYELCHLSSTHAECWKTGMLTAWCRSSVVSVSLQRRLSFSMKIQGTPGILRKNTLASTGGDRHKMLFHWCYGERCSQCLQPDWGRNVVCTPDASGHVSMKCQKMQWLVYLLHSGSPQTAWVPDGCFRESKKGPSMYCTLAWSTYAAKIQACVKTACYERESAWQNYSRDYNKGSQCAKRGTHSCRLGELIFLGLHVSQPW